MAGAGTNSEMKTTPRRWVPSGSMRRDVEAEVDFFEAGVEGDGDALEADAVEEEADEGDEAGVWSGLGRGRARRRRGR